MASNWNLGLSIDNKVLIFKALLHMVHDTDAPLTEEEANIADKHIDAMLALSERGARIGIVNELSDQAVDVVLAAMMAAFRDNHMFQYNLEEPQWELAEKMAAELNHDGTVKLFLNSTTTFHQDAEKAS